MELIQALESLDPEKKVFEHNLMLKTNRENYKRWDEKYFSTLFSNLDATKIWVCGPPIMQESFDRAAMASSNTNLEFAAL